MRRRHLLTSALVFALTSCSDSWLNGSDAEEVGIGGQQIVSSAVEQNDTQQTNTLSDEDPETSVFLALEGEGLRVFYADTGVARPIPFGSTQDEVVAILTSLQDGAPREVGTSADCAADYAAWESGLTAWFSGDHFVGWFVREGTGTLTTASGVGIGSTREELETSYDAEILPTSIGIEFTAGGLAGLLDSERPDASIVGLWAGATCIAR